MSNVLRNLVRRFTTEKVQTIYTGLYHDTESIPKLRNIYEQTKLALSSFPENYYYRKSLETTINDRLRLLDIDSNAHAVEKFEEGLTEEVLEQAQEELELVQKMLEWKPWEELEELDPNSP